MSKPSRRPTREARKIRATEKFSGAVAGAILNRLSKIPDPRNPKTVKHKLTVVLLYGLLIFVFNFSSRREAGRRLTMTQFKENLKLLFPELEDLPHHDTLNRVLSELKVDEIEAALVEEIGRLVRNRKFARYLVGKSYLVAIDATCKFTRNNRWSEECLQQRVGEEDHQYYVYVLEANLVLGNGVTIPCLSEFLQFAEEDPEAGKQDCELKAFYRLAKRLKTYFPRLPITVLLDGLYARGPVIALCRRYKWDFMIVLKDDSLPSVWEEFHGLGRLQEGQSSIGMRLICFHYLMRLGHFLNVLAHNSVYLVNTVRMLGMRGLVQFIRDTLSSPWLDAARIQNLLDQPHQLRLA